MTPHLKTERLRLYAPHHRAFDIEQQVSWLNDKETMKYSGQRHGHHSVKTQRDYIKSFDHIDRHFWEISRKHGDYDRPIGTITAYRDKYNNTANIGLLIRRKSWGHGYGYEAWQAVMDWLFSDGVRKCEAGAYSKNIGMLNIFHKSRMMVEGVRRSSILLGDDWCDIIEVGRFNDAGKGLSTVCRTDIKPVGPKDGYVCDSLQLTATGSSG